MAVFIDDRFDFDLFEIVVLVTVYGWLVETGFSHAKTTIFLIFRRTRRWRGWKAGTTATRSSANMSTTTLRPPSTRRSWYRCARPPRPRPRDLHFLHFSFTWKGRLIIVGFWRILFFIASFVNNILALNQCCGPGSAWIRINLPSGSGSSYLNISVKSQNLLRSAKF